MSKSYEDADDEWTKRAVIRKILSVIILAVLVSWIVLSYLPAGWLTLPQFAFSGPWSTPVLQLLAALGLVGFVVIQGILVRDTGRMLRPHGAREEIMAEFRLKRGVELFWTALPLLMTIGLGVAAYQTWLNLP